MWTLLPKDKLSQYEDKYKLFEKYPEQEYILYTNDTHFFFPRYFFKNFPDENLVQHIDREFKPQSIEYIEYTGELRDYQHPIVKPFIDLFNNTGSVNGLLNAYPGAGKTAMAIYLACIFKKKTLIVVDNEKLKEQFIESIVKFTNITEENIGTIQGSKFDTDKPIVITMVQTLLSKLKRNLKEFYIQVRDCGFDFVVYDEVHKTSSSSKYAMSTLFINSKNIIGLSATPYVREVHALLLFNTIGDIIHTTKDYEFIPKIFYVKYDSRLDQKTKYRAKFIKDYVRLQAFYNSIIFDNHNYLNVLYKLSKKCLESEHRVMILVSTVKQIETIIDFLSKLGIPAKALYSKQTEVDKENDFLLVGTFKYCSAGFDFKELSALILASPYKGKISLVQSIGRVLRLAPGKKSPVVFDLMDKQFPNLFESNIATKNKVFIDEFGDCEIHYVDAD
jgi:superfamily II DNA or RNA helicase